MLGYSYCDYIYKEFFQLLGLYYIFGVLSVLLFFLLMSGYVLGYDDDFKYFVFKSLVGVMVVIVEDVVVFFRVFNDGLLFIQEE